MISIQLSVMVVSPPQEGTKGGSSTASDEVSKSGDDVVDSGSKDFGSSLAILSSQQLTSIKQETRLELYKSPSQNVENQTPSKLTTSPCSNGLKRPLPPPVVVSTSPSSNFPSLGKRSRVSIIREPAAPPPAPKISSKLVRWLPIPTELDWNTIQRSPIPRMGHRAVMLNSKLIIFGGGNQQINHELLVFAIPSKTWSMPQEKGDVPVGRASYGMETLGNHVYMFGGLIEHGYYVNDLYRLDVDSWTWTKLNPTGEIPCARFGHSFTRLNDSFYVFGGLTDDTPTPPRMEMPRYLGDFYKLNVSSNLEEVSWEIPSVFGSMPGPRESHSAVAYFTSSLRYNRLIIYGGMCGRRLNDLYFMDVDTRVWTKPTIRGIPPAPRSMHSANVVGNTMYVFGGWTPVSEYGEVDQRKCREVQNVWKVTSELQCLNLESLSWEQVAQRDKQGETMFWPKARAGHCSAAGQTKIYMWGGKDGFNLDENGKQMCLPEMLELVVEKPGVPGKVQLVTANCNSLVVQWGAVEGADSYVIQCCTYDLPVLMPPPTVQMPMPQPAIMKPPPIPAAMPTSVSAQGKLVIPPTPTPVRIKQEPLEQDSMQVPQLKLAPRQPIPITLLRGLHPSSSTSSSVPNVMPLVLSGGANRMPCQGQQYRLPTGQIITLQSPISQGGRLPQPQRIQFLSRPTIQFQQIQRQPQQQQQQPVLNFFRNPSQLDNHQLYYSNSGSQQGARRIYFFPQSRAGGSGVPAFAPVPHSIQQQQQQGAITYFRGPPLPRPNLSLGGRMPTSGQIPTRCPQLGLGFGRLPQVPVTGLAPRAAPPFTVKCESFTSKSSAAPPPPPPPPSRHPPPSSSS
ncbi:unnamed protein product [Orchesella dallaii]|uniref:Host cell factor Kelch-repeats domain-containing protein n=1 Tax=Orchesella dallaii TaxID=48710 RepID=A0ABP1RYT5_9HEXA